MRPQEFLLAAIHLAVLNVVQSSTWLMLASCVLGAMGLVASFRAFRAENPA